MSSPIRALKSLIRKIPDPVLQNNFSDWVNNYILEFGCSVDVTQEQKNDEAFMRHKIECLVQELGFNVMEKCAEEELSEGLNMSSFTFRLYVINAKGKDSDSIEQKEGM